MANLDVFFKAVSSVRRSQQDLLKLKQSRQRLAHEEDIFELKKRRQQLALDEAEASGQITKIKRKIYEQDANTYFKQQEEILKGKNAMIDMEEDKQTALSDKSMALAKEVVKRDPLVKDQLKTIYSSSGNIGFGRKGDIKQKTSGFSQKDVIDCAIKLKRESGDDSKSVKDYMQEARALLGGVPDIQKSHPPTFPKEGSRANRKSTSAKSGVKSKYKAGDKREINGVEYIRNESGQWIPQS